MWVSSLDLFAYLSAGGYYTTCICRPVIQETATCGNIYALEIDIKPEMWSCLILLAGAVVHPDLVSSKSIRKYAVARL